MVGWHRERSCLFIKLSGCKIFYLKDDDRPYCEDWNYVDIVSRYGEPHATENPPISLPGINFLEL